MKKSFIDTFKAIEQNFPVDSISINGISVWSYLRVKCWIGLNKQVFQSESSINSLLVRIKLIKTLFYGWKNWFRKYDYLFFSCAENRKKIDGMYEDRFIDPIIDLLGAEKCLAIELTTSAHIPLKYLKNKNVTSDILLKVIGLLIRPFVMLRIIGKSILDGINQSHNLKFNYVKYCREFIANSVVRYVLLRIYRPKLIFVVCYYSYCDVIAVARRLGIEVVEVQHGVITGAHPSYNVGINLHAPFFPDYLLSFGAVDRSILSNSKFLKAEDIVPVGSYFLDYVISLSDGLCHIRELSRSYVKVVAVSSQYTIEDKLIEFLRAAANIDSSILFIFIPREKSKDYYEKYNFPSSIKIVEEMNFYTITKAADFHSTVYSTCALEAPSLGVQNILINIDGYSKVYYGGLLNDPRITRYVENPEDFVSTIHSFEILPKQYVMEQNRQIFAPNYIQNVSNFLSSKLCQPVTGC